MQQAAQAGPIWSLGQLAALGISHHPVYYYSVTTPYYHSLPIPRFDLVLRDRVQQSKLLTKRQDPPHSAASLIRVFRTSLNSIYIVRLVWIIL